MFGSKDRRRRLKQQARQAIGTAEKTEDHAFRQDYSEYKNTCHQLRNLKKTMQKHLEAIRQMHQTGAALAMELAAFHQSTAAAESTVQLGHLYAEMERVHLSSVERLYEEEVSSAADLLLWQTAEVEEKAKERKKLMLDYDAHLRKYDNLTKSKMQELSQSTESRKAGSSRGGFFKKKRSEEDVAEEMATRKVKLEKSEEAVTQSTAWLEEQFKSLEEKRQAGTILEGPMSAMLACHLHLMQHFSAQIERVAPTYASMDLYMKTLDQYDKEPSEFNAIDVAGVAQMANNTMASMKRKQSVKRGLVFGATLKESTPPFVCDCIAFIRADGLNTEGLFRVSGSQDAVDQLKGRYDLGEKGVLTSIDDLTVFDACTALKQWLRELQDPLIPSDQYAPLMELMREDLNLEKKETQASALELIATLPVENRHVLAMISRLLLDITEHKEENKMNEMNLATCLAPSLLRAPEGSEAALVIGDIQPAIAACRTFIRTAMKMEAPSDKQILESTTIDLPNGTNV